MPRWLSYALSWLHADLIGHIVCRWYGHVIPEPDHIRFIDQLADVFDHPADSEARDLICRRCGAVLPESA